MASNSAIEWTGSTWNPVTGCVKISTGCKHCYAERMAKRLQAMGQKNYVTGFDLAMHEHALELPLSWKKPQTIFVNSMSDLFLAGVPTDFIQQVFDVMRRAHWHTFQLLTKRGERLSDLSNELIWADNIWMGVSVENSEYVTRIDHLRVTGAKVKFLSIEPLLGPVPNLDLRGIDWVIVGGESGPGARPMKEEWVVEIKDQCLAARVPFFFKQWGGVRKKKAGRELQGQIWDQVPRQYREKLKAEGVEKKSEQLDEQKQKLELTWIGKENRPKLEPRILLEDAENSYHAQHRLSDKDIFDNRLIFGDNLLALKALEQEFAGKVKCVFIDPPYNTGNAFEHYDDGLEHSIWLSLMRDRLEIFRNLLSDDGSLWITIDDNEAHYLKVMCDEVFGRKNFIISIAWQKVFAKKNKALISGSHDHILVISKDSDKWQRNLLPREGAALSAFKNPDEDSRGLWQSVAYSVQSEDAEKRKAYRYPILLPSGREVMPPTGRHWNGLPNRTEQLRKDNRLWFGKAGDSPPRIKVFLSEVQSGIVPDTWWTHSDAGSNQGSKKEMLSLFPGLEPFSTPKPELLLQRVLTIATNPNDLVLDSFSGSGTTGAVAHKMGRRWIMVELGEHCHTHIIPRMQQVIDGTDQGGISEAINWKGGGGFRYYHLAPSLMEKDKWDNWVISKEYNSAMMAEAVCKLEGFNYAPSETLYWQHGHSTETDFIYVTTQNLSHEQLQQISAEVGKSRTLLVCCSAFRGRADAFPNLTIKKIPNAVLSRCEWGHDDYSLNVENLPQKPPEPGQQDLF